MNSLENNSRNISRYTSNFNNIQQTQQNSNGTSTAQQSFYPVNDSINDPSNDPAFKFFFVDSNQYEKIINTPIETSFIPTNRENPSGNQNVHAPDFLKQAEQDFTQANQSFTQFVNTLHFYPRGEDSKCIQHFIATAHELLYQLLINHKIDDYNFYHTMTISTLNKARKKFPNYPPDIFNLLSNICHPSLLTEINRHNATKNATQDNTALYTIVPHHYSGAELLDFVLNSTEKHKRKGHKRPRKQTPTTQKNKRAKKLGPRNAYLSQPGISITADTNMQDYFRRLSNSLDTRTYFDPSLDASSWLDNLNVYGDSEENLKKTIVVVYATLLYLHRFKKRKTYENLALSMLKTYLKQHISLQHYMDINNKRLSDPIKSWLMNQRTPLCIAKILYCAHIEMDEKKSQKSKSGHNTIGIKQFLQHQIQILLSTNNEDKNKKLPNLTCQEFLNETCPGWKDQPLNA